MADKSINAGDSCNTSFIKMPSHAGTHVDAPLHFLLKGKSVEEYEPKAWIFKHPQVVFFNVTPGQLIRTEDLPLNDKGNRKTDLLLLRSDFEKHRKSDTYWQDGPGLSSELAEYFLDSFPSLRAVGMDFISVSSLKHREAGRAAHRSFLEREILLFEDMSLKHLRLGDTIERVIALPLRFACGDGAPCTIVGFKR
jgi:kynurenine formamidase